MKKILYLMYRFPYPLDKGDKLRAFNFIKELSKNYELQLISIIDEDIDPSWINIVKKYVAKIHLINFSKKKLFKNIVLNLFNGKPFQNAFVYDKKIQKEIQKIIDNEKFDYAICLMVRASEYLDKINVRKILDYQDTLSIGFKRRAEKSKFIKKLFYMIEAKRLENFEKKIFDKYNIKLIITEEDRKYINHKDKEQIIVVPNGIDLEYFSAKTAEKRDFDLLFVGNMQYEPNILCVKYIVSQIFPLILKHRPNAKLMIAGADPTDEIKRLQNDNVVITGRLDDIREAYLRGKVFLAPLNTGTGLQNKLLEAMAMQVPVVTSELCNKALNAKENYEILIGRTPKEYANHCLNLLNNEEIYYKIQANAYSFVKSNFSWEKNVQILKNFIDKLN